MAKHREGFRDTLPTPPFRRDGGVALSVVGTILPKFLNKSAMQTRSPIGYWQIFLHGCWKSAPGTAKFGFLGKNHDFFRPSAV